MVICIDNSDGGYWRKDVYNDYKANRKVGREKSDINYTEVFVEIDELIEQLKQNIPWKVIDVPRAEADDIMLILAREFNKYEPILIHSPDKDMIQAQRGNDTVEQFSPMTRKWLLPENKYTDMNHWVQEHVCLGDTSDNVPKIVDHTEFSDSFIKYLITESYENILSPLEFKHSNIDIETKKQLLINFDEWKFNRKGENLGIKDIYKDMSFGPSTLDKSIKKHGSLNNFLETNPLYKQHFDRNFTLVMEEGIPKYIADEIIIKFKEAPINYNSVKFEEYLRKYRLDNILLTLPNVFKINHELTADDFNW